MVKKTTDHKSNLRPGDRQYMVMGIVEMCGRKVTRLSNINLETRDSYGQNMTCMRCADCGERANYLIVEDDGTAWPYCGVCEIGG